MQKQPSVLSSPKQLKKPALKVPKLTLRNVGDSQGKLSQRGPRASYVDSTVKQPGKSTSGDESIRDLQQANNSAGSQTGS